MRAGGSPALLTRRGWHIEDGESQTECAPACDRRDGAGAPEAASVLHWAGGCGVLQPAWNADQRKQRAAAGLHPGGQGAGNLAAFLARLPDSHATFTESIGMHARDRQALMGHGALDQTDRYTMEDLERMRGGLDKIAGMITGEVETVQ